MKKCGAGAADAGHGVAWSRGFRTLVRGVHMDPGRISAVLSTATRRSTWRVTLPASVVLRSAPTAWKTFPGLSGGGPDPGLRFARWVFLRATRTISKILQATSTEICVVRNPLKKARRGFVDRTSPSASLASRDILYRPTGAGRNGAECGALRPCIRTTGTGRRTPFEPFCASLRPLSLAQLNHGQFG
jgi:hypothetical protein